MSPKSKGFFLLELLLSLSAWFMLGLYFVPLLIDLKTQSQQLERDKTANQFLYEELQAKLNDNQVYSSYSILHNGVVYGVDWKESAETGLREVCVSVEGNNFISKTQVCARPE